MSARAIGDIIAPILVHAVGLARLQHFLDCFDPAEREEWIADFLEHHTITASEAALLREHNWEEAA